MNDKVKKEKTQILEKLNLFLREYVNAPDIHTKEGEETILFYVNYLYGFGLEIASEAIDEILYTNTTVFFPKLPTFVAAVRSVFEDRLPTSGSAWAEVQREIGRRGSTRSPEFSHPIIMEAVSEVGGWDYLCRSGDFMSDRSQFYKVFDQIKDRAIKQELRNAVSH